MSEKKIDIELATTATGSGLADTAKGMEDLKKGADQTAAPVGKVTDALDKLAKDDFLKNNPIKKVKEDSEAAAGGLEKTAAAAKSLIDGLRAGQGSFDGIRGVLRGITTDASAAEGGLGKLGTRASGLGAIVAAGLAGWKIGSWLMDMKQQLEDSLSGLSEWKERIAAAMDDAGKRRVRWDGIKAASDAAVADLDRVLSRLEAVAAAESRSAKAKASVDIAKIEDEGVRAAAAAVTPEEKAAAEALAKARVTQRQNAADLAALDQQIKDEGRKWITALLKAEEASSELAKMEKETAEKLRAYRDLVALKVAAGASSDEAQNDPEVAAARRDAAQASSDYRGRQQTVGPQVQDYRIQARAAEENQRALADERAAAVQRQQTSGFQSGQDVTTSINGLKSALQEATQRLAAARQANTFAGGATDAVSQQAAYTGVVGAQKEVDRLRAVLAAAEKAAAEGLSKTSASFTEGAASVTKKAADAAAAVTDKARAATADLDKASGAVTEKVQAASGQVSQAVVGMGNTIAGSLGTLQSTLVSTLTTMNAQVSSLQQQLNSTRALAASAAAKADLTSEQVRNSR